MHFKPLSSDTPKFNICFLLKGIILYFSVVTEDTLRIWYKVWTVVYHRVNRSNTGSIFRNENIQLPVTRIPLKWCG